MATGLISKRLSARLAGFLGLIGLTVLLLIGGKSVDAVIHPLTTHRNLSVDFSSEPLGRSYYLFDLGVTDADGDGWLDIYTTNHGARQRLLLNQMGVGFQDHLVEAGLSQSASFPGAEPDLSAPRMNQPGLYIYWKKQTLTLKSHQLSERVLGKLTFLEDTRQSDLRVVTEQAASSEIKEITQPSGEYQTEVSFTLAPGGQLSFQANLTATQFQLSETTALPDVFLGSERHQAREHSFTLQLKDRHGMAWADVNGDGDRDVFITRGGIRGRMDQLAPDLSDELMIADATGYSDRTEQWAIAKRGCPGRQVGWTDVDNDQQLDLYLVCGREGGLGNDFPNLLYRREDTGQFVEQAQSWGLDLPGSGHFAWLDADLDGDLDLLWAGADAYWLYVHQSDRFVANRLADAPGDTKRFALADYDGDGKLDAFAVSPTQSTLFTGASQYQPVSPIQLGLPEQVDDANWIDVDNDGYIDLHTLPGGVYKQTGHPMDRSVNHSANHSTDRSTSVSQKPRFVATGQLAQKATGYPRGVMTSWFDADNDGDRDLLLAIEQQPNLAARVWDKGQRIWHEKVKKQPAQPAPPRVSELILYRNQQPLNHWLEADLRSTRLADVMGASVTVTTAEHRQTQQIGQFESALYSQGHYRLYFGLGRQRPQQITVTWLDGETTQLDGIDEILAIPRPKKSQAKSLSLKVSG